MTRVSPDIVGGPPTVIATVVSQNEIDLTWTPVLNATKFYIYERIPPDPGPDAYITTIRGQDSFQATHLEQGTQYCFQVEGEDAQGEDSGRSTEVCASTTGALPAPTNVVATSTAPTRVSVTWNAVALAAKYFVFRSDAGGPFNYLTSAQSASTSDATVDQTTNYCYEIQAVDSAGNTSALSAPGCTTTTSEGLEGTYKLNEKSGTTAIDSSGNGRDGTLAGNVSYITTGLPPALADNKSALSFGGGAGDAVNIPSVNAFNFQGDFAVAFWVNIGAGANGPIIGKRAAGCGAVVWQIAQSGGTLHLDSDGGQLSFGQALPAGTWTHVAVSEDISASTATLYINGAQVATGTYVAGPGNTDPLQFGNAGGCGGAAVELDQISLYSTGLSASEIAALGTQPPAPTLTATAQASFAVGLSWSTVANAQKYFVYRGTSPGTEQFVATVFGTSYTDTHLTQNTQYFWVVSDQVNGLLSNDSNEATATTQAAPGAPTNVVADSEGPSECGLNWDAIANAVKYYVFISSDGGSTYSFQNTVRAPGTSLSIRNLTESTTYTFVVESETPNGDSADSAPATCTTTSSTGSGSGSGSGG